MQCFEKVLQHDPRNVDARFWLGLCLYHRLQDYKKAEQVFAQAVELDPYRADCISQLAYIHWEEKQFNTSLDYLRRAIQISPDWPMLRVELIYLLLHLGRHEEAEQALVEAMFLLDYTEKNPENEPKNEVAHYYEHVITGRSWNNLAEKIKHLKLLLIHK